MKYLKKTRKFLFRNSPEILLGAMILFFLAGTFAFLLYTQDYSTDLTKQPDYIKWISPDETANYIFAKLYAQEGIISLKENYNLLVDDIMRPRSFRSDHGVLKPVSFLGIILIYGKIAGFFSYKIIPFLTPIMAVIGVVYFYLFVRKIFGRNNAFLSSMMLVTFPPFVYYSARSMFHNVLFVVLLLISLYYAYLMTEKVRPMKKLEDVFRYSCLRAYVFSALGGIFLGLAVMTRTSELLWIAPLYLLIWLFNIKRAGFLRVLVFLTAFVFALTPMFYYNNLLYGSFFSGGYPEMNDSIHTLAVAGTEVVTNTVKAEWSYLGSVFQVIKSTIFHFGFDREMSIEKFKGYFMGMFSWLYWLGILGAVVFFTRIKQQRYSQWIYLAGGVLLSMILIFYYGSWQFNDNPDLSAVTIGNSYTRYWLPVYMFFMPFASLFIMRITRYFCLVMNRRLKDDEDDSEESIDTEQQSLFTHNERLFCRNMLRLAVLVVIIYISLNYLLYGSEEGLVPTARKAAAAQAEWQKVLELTEHNSAIVTRYHDKVFFPERKVVVGLFDDMSMNERYHRLAQELPLYYYNFKFDDATVEYLNDRRLAEVGLSIELVEDVNEVFSLYKLEVVNSK